MSEKNLLKEGTIRRFMKLAGTGAITDNFLTETEEIGDTLEEQEEEQEEEDEAPPDLGAPAAEGEELPPEGEPEGDLEMELPEPDLEDEELAEPDAEDDEAEFDPEDLALQLYKTLGEEAGEEAEMEVGGEGELGMAAEEEPEELEEINYVDEDMLMQETYRRVVSRLAQEKRADKMATILAEKIYRRLGRKS